MAIEEGSRVRQVVTPIVGVVADVEYDKSAKQLRYLVEYDDAEGETHQRWFTEAELEEDGNA